VTRDKQSNGRRVEIESYFVSVALYLDRRSHSAVGAELAVIRRKLPDWPASSRREANLKLTHSSFWSD